MDGVDVAVYLVHSLDDNDFERKDAEAAQGFGLAAAASGVRQIVYMGGLGKDDVELSPHLRSRREVEQLLGTSGVPVTVLRAAIVVGAGGISWEMTRQLVKNLPAMVVPRWADTRTQPIALDDVIRYLAGVIGVEKTYGQVYEIGGADRLTYVQMLQQAAEVINGRRVPIVTVPVLTPRLSSLLDRPGHRRRLHHRQQPHRLDEHRGAPDRLLHPGHRPRRADDLPGGRRAAVPRTPPLGESARSRARSFCRRRPSRSGLSATQSVS